MHLSNSNSTNISHAGTTIRVIREIPMDRAMVVTTTALNRTKTGEVTDNLRTDHPMGLLPAPMVVVAAEISMDPLRDGVTDPNMAETRAMDRRRTDRRTDPASGSVLQEEAEADTVVEETVVVEEETDIEETVTEKLLKRTKFTSQSF